MWPLRGPVEALLWLRRLRRRPRHMWAEAAEAHVGGGGLFTGNIDLECTINLLIVMVVFACVRSPAPCAIAWRCRGGLSAQRLWTDLRGHLRQRRAPGRGARCRVTIRVTLDSVPAHGTGHLCRADNLKFDKENAGIPANANPTRNRSRKRTLLVNYCIFSFGRASRVAVGVAPNLAVPGLA